MTWRRALAVTAGVCAAALALSYGAQRLYLAPRADLADEIALYRGDIAAKQEHVAKLREIRARLLEIAGTTLAAEADTLEHRLRTELVALSEAAGLTAVEVKTGRPIPRLNPVTSAPIRERSLRSALRDQADFYSAPATLEGEGSLREVAEALALLQEQRWVARVDNFSIKPGADRKRFGLRVALTTLFLPDLAAEAQPGTPALVELPPDSAALVEQMASRNVFRRPDPPAPVIVQKAPDPPAPAPPPAPAKPALEDWRLAGVMRGTSGASAILVNSRTRETRTLAPGEEVLGFVFVAGAGERAEFVRGEERVVLSNGQTLAQGNEPR